VTSLESVCSPQFTKPDHFTQIPQGRQMSVIAIYHQVPKQCILGILKGEEGSGYEFKIVHWLLNESLTF